MWNKLSWQTTVALLERELTDSGILQPKRRRDQPSHGRGKWLPVSFSLDGFEQRSYNLITSPGRIVERWLFNLLQDVDFLFGGQDHEFYTCPISVSALIAPDQHAELLPSHGFLKMDQAGFYPFSQLYPHANHADIHDPDTVFRPRVLGETNDIQRICSR